MKKIVKNDRIMVIAGRDKGMTGTVNKVLTDGRLLVSGIHLVRKHTKPNPQRNQTGGIVEKEAPIQASNVALVNPATGRPDRVGFRFGENGKKERYFKSDKSSVSS